MENFELLDYDKQDIYLYISSNAEKNIRLKSCKREPQTVDWIENLPDESVFLILVLISGVIV